jgi:hypothetical protein
MGRLGTSSRNFRNPFRRRFNDSVALVLGYKFGLDRCEQNPWGGRPGIRLADTGIGSEVRPEKHQRFIQWNGKVINGERVLSEEHGGYIFLPQFYVLEDWWKTIGHHLDKVIAAADTSGGEIDSGKLLREAFELSCRESFKGCLLQSISCSDRKNVWVPAYFARTRKPRKGGNLPSIAIWPPMSAHAVYSRTVS